jgi:hypothetical protein
MFPAWCSVFGSGGKFKSPSKKWSVATWVTLEGPTTDALIRHQLLDRRQTKNYRRYALLIVSWRASVDVPSRLAGPTEPFLVRLPT